MYLMNCPLPVYQGNVTNLNIDGFSVTYNVTYSSSNSTGSLFECYTTGNLFGVNEIVKDYGATAFGAIPYGWLGYTADSLTILFQRVQALFTLISFFISPTNFNILGYTIADISGIALMFVIAIYALCYISVGAWLYKTFSPFSGVG